MNYGLLNNKNFISGKVRGCDRRSAEVGRVDQKANDQAGGGPENQVKPVCENAIAKDRGRNQKQDKRETYQLRLRQRVLEYNKNDTPDGNKSFKLHDKGIQII